MAAVIDTLLDSGAFKKSVCHICPCCPPEDKLLFAIPTCSNRVLPPILGAFRILGYSLHPLRFSRRGCHINLLLSNPILILLLPALHLRRLELRCCKAPLLAILDAQIFLLCFMLPFAILGQRPHGQHDVSMGIVTIRIVNRNVGAHPIRYKASLNEVRQQCDPLLTSQFNR